MLFRRDPKDAIRIAPHVAWYLIVGAALLVPVFVMHAVIAWRAIDGPAIKPVHAASPDRGSSPVLVRDR